MQKEHRMQRTVAFRAVVAIAIATACCASLAQGSGQVSAASTSGARAGAAQRGEPPHSLVIVPAAITMSTDFAKGCWVRLYDGKDFQGQELMLVGPMRLGGMGPTSPWWRRWNSAIVGPNARVTIYSGENYEGRSAALSARQRSVDLAGKDVGWSGKIESAQVDCSVS